MGCHTWCYAHVTEKAKEWNHEYAEALINGCKEAIEMWESCTLQEMEEYVEEINSANDDFLDFVKKVGREKTIKEQFDCNEKAFEKYYTLAQIRLTKESWLTQQIKFEKDTIEAFNKYGEDRVVEYINDNFNNSAIITDPYNFNLFIVKDGKIYRDTSDEKVFRKQFHDVFRIGDYEAKPCYSLEDTLQRCKEYNVDWDEKYPNSDTLINNISRIEEFWKTYPDGIITFG